MNKVILVLIIVATFSLTGCGDKEAREYATKLVPVLDAYQHELTAKINAEQESYERLAAAYAKAHHDDIMIRLVGQRASRAREATDTIVADGKAPTTSEIIRLLQEYAKEDFDMTRSLFQEGMDSRSRMLADLEDLEIELQKIKLLREALTELSKPDSDVKRLRATAESIAKTAEATKKLFSADAKTSADALKAATESEGDSQAAAGSKGKKTSSTP